MSRPHAAARRLGSSSVAGLIARYAAGATCQQLAEAYGISQTAVKDLLHRQGVQLRRPVGLSAEEIAAAAGLYEAGWLLREIGEKFGVSQETVRRRLVERGLVMRSGHGDHGQRRRSA